MAWNRRNDMIGKRFNRWIVLSDAGTLKEKAMYLCKCDCGVEKIVAGSSLLMNNSKSCGCLNIERIKARTTIHSMSLSVVYSRWINMKKRCCNKKRKDYKWYGGRGITVCERWLNSFENFYEDMGDVPFKTAEIDRIDNDLGYSKDNCRWTTHIVNSRNSRGKLNLTFNGQTLTATEWSKLVGINLTTIQNRINRNGWSVERALTEKPMIGKNQFADRSST